MKRILSLVTVIMLSSIVLSSCMKDEKPYAVPKAPESGGEFDIKNNKVTMGEDYGTQIYFSFSGGQVATSNYKVWDIAISNKTDSAELWMNGGKMVLIYPTGLTNFSDITDVNNVTDDAWRYDNPSGLSGESGLGLLTNSNHVGKVLLVDDGEGSYFKLQILEITSASYKIKVGKITDIAGKEVVLQRDENYNFAFYSFADGVIKPEPPKKDWDVLFVRYRHVYYAYNPDGSDMLYYVNGAITNPYKTLSGAYPEKHDFYSFGLEKAEALEMLPNRDNIGFDWKSVNINTGQYTVQTENIFVIKDQNEWLWKLRFVNFYDENNKKGSPQFEFQRLK